MGKVGFKHALEAIEKIRRASLGRKYPGRVHSEERRRKMSVSMMGVHLGRKHTKQAKLNMSLAHIGKKQSTEQIAKRAAKLRGRKFPPRSLEFRLKMSLAKKGTPCPEHVRQIVSKIHKGKTISDATRLNMSIAQKKRATQNHFYIDGRCQERVNERSIASNSFRYKQWRRAVFVRDKYTCQDCGVNGVTIHADHVRPWSTYPSLRYDILNGKTLCVPCHKKTDTWGLRRLKTETLWPG